MTSNAAKLYRKIMSDKSVQTELAKAGGTADIEAIVRLGEAHGLPVTPEEVRGFLVREPGEELTDAELEMVVGGKGNPGEKINGDEWAWIGLIDDDLFGGSGNDTMSGGVGSDYMTGGAGNDSMSGDANGDWMEGGAGDDTMSGGVGDDVIQGETGNDSMDGDSGNDGMWGGSGNDSMSGGAGDDWMEGGSGNDTLDGGAGWDWMEGGAGNDVFVFGLNDGTDMITDFNPQQDRLLLQGGTAESIGVSVWDGNTNITFGQTIITLQGVVMNKGQVLDCVDF